MVIVTAIRGGGFPPYYGRARDLVWCVLNSVRISQAFLRQFGANATKHSDYVRKHLRQNAQKGCENVMNL